MTLDLIVNRQNHENWFKILLLVVGIPGLLTFPIVIYVIFTKSTSNMDRYKWVLANGAINNFIFTLIMVSLRPVLLLPYFLIYSVGSNFLFDWKISEFLLAIIQFTLSNMAIGLLLFLAHIYYVMNRVNFGSFLSKIWHIIVLMVILYAIVFVCLGLFIPCDMPRENIRTEFVKINQELDIFFQEHDLFTGLYENCPTLKIGFLYCFSMGVIIFGLGISLNIKLYRLLRQNHPHIIPETRRVQMTLYRTYTIQSIVLCICFGTPCLLLNLTILTGYINELIASLYTVTILTAYLFINNMIVLFSVKPYRMFIFGKLNAFLNLFGVQIKCLANNSNIMTVVALH